MGKSILGTNDVGSVKFGTADVKMYLGTNLLYPLYKAKIKLSTTNDYVYIPFDGTGTTITRTEVSDVVSSQTLTAITDVEILYPTTEIGNAAFGDAVNCTALTLSDSLVIINNGAFAGISAEHIVVPDSVETINAGAFADSRAMKTAVIGSGVTSIGSAALSSSFNQNTVQSLTFKSVNPPRLVDINMFDSTDDCPIYVPSTSVNAYKAADIWQTYASRIQAIPSGNNAWDAAIK